MGPNRLQLRVERGGAPVRTDRTVVAVEVVKNSSKRSPALWVVGADLDGTLGGADSVFVLLEFGENAAQPASPRYDQIKSISGSSSAARVYASAASGSRRRL
jgi:hypothetical protein